MYLKLFFSFFQDVWQARVDRGRVDRGRVDRGRVDQTREWPN